MQCPRCQAQNDQDAKFCEDCGARLEAVCPSCGQPVGTGKKFCRSCGASLIADPNRFTSPQAYTPKHLAEKILTSKTALEGERKQVTVLFCDIANSTALAERLGPEPMHGILNQFFELALGEVHRYEGTINQFLGDGFMALFGAPLAHEDHARRAALAALGIRRAVQERPLQAEPGRPVSVSLRLGVHTGFVVVGAIGDNLRMDYTAVGDTTHLAARLQQLAEPGTIVVSDATARLVLGYVRLEPLGQVEVRGRSTPVAIYRISGPGARRSPLEGVEDRRLSHFVGRDRELTILHDLLAQMETGRGQVVGVVGEPGVGKSRLLLEFRRTLAGRRLTYLEGRCLSFGSAIPYVPVLDILRANCGLGEGDTPETVIEKVQVAVREVGIEAEAAAPFVLHLLGIKDPAERLTGLSPEAIKARTFDTLRQMSIKGSQRRPVIFAVEDLHWIDRTSEEYFAWLVESLAGVPILLLCTYRPGYRPSWIEKSYATQISLARLAANDSLTVIRSVLPPSGLAEPLARLILEKAEGNPFFLEELAKAVGEQGEAHSSLTIPDTVHAVLTARIDRLPEAPKRLLQTASVLGREFSVRLLDTVWDGGDLRAHVRELTRQEFLYERSVGDEPTYAFKHALTQDVAEATILASRKRELHRRAAKALATLYPDRLDDLSPMLAHHYYEAEEWSQACEHATRAAEAADAAYANREALERYDQALAAGERAGLPGAGQRRLLAARARVHAVLGAFDPARADLETALALAEAPSDMSVRAELLGMLGELWGGHKDYRRGLDLTLEAVRVAERAGDQRALADAVVRTGLMELNLARIGEGRRQLERALGIFSELGDERGSAQALDILSMAENVGGRLGRSLAYAREALRRFQALGDRMAEPSLISNIGFSLSFAGKRAEAEPLIRQGLEAAIAVGSRAGEAFVHMGLSQTAELYGELGPAYREATLGLDIARQIGHLEWTAGALGMLGRVYRTCGDWANARRLHEEMLSITRELGTALWTSEAFTNLGEDLLAVGDEEEGRRLLDEAVTMAGEALRFSTAPLLARAALWLRLGRPEEALETARQLRSSFSEPSIFVLPAGRLEGEALIALGQADTGEWALRDAKKDALAMDCISEQWRIGLVLDRLLTGQGRRIEAETERTRARALLERVAADLPAELARQFAATEAMRQACQASVDRSL